MADERRDRRAGGRQLGRESVQPHESLVHEHDPIIGIDNVHALGDIGENRLELARRLGWRVTPERREGRRHSFSSHRPSTQARRFGEGLTRISHTRSVICG